MPTAQGTILALAFFPTSFFFNAVYTESLFLALSTTAVWATRVRKDLLLARLWRGWRQRRGTLLYCCRSS